MSDKEKVLYWLIDYTVPDFMSGFGKEELKGRLLIASRQLWSLISGEQVRSALIGPGYVQGIIRKPTGEIDFEERISAIIFDPTELRPTEPLPLVNLISPEVIDPTAKSSEEEIEESVKRTVVTREEPTATEKIAKADSLTSTQPVQRTPTRKTKLKIRYISGETRAKFALSGMHRKIYAPYISNLKRKKYDDINALKIFLVDKREMTEPKKEALSDWMIIEQNTETIEPEETPRDGYAQIVEEYRHTLEFIKAKPSSYILL